MSTQMDSPTPVQTESGWSFMIYFAAALMFLVGTLQVIAGLFAIFNDEWVVWGSEAAVLLDITGWGWLHVIIGALIILSGLLLLQGSMVGRVVAVVMAVVSAIVNFVWLPVYPLWGIIMITIDVLIIYAVTAHGRELKY